MIHQWARLSFCLELLEELEDAAIDFGHSGQERHLKDMQAAHYKLETVLRNLLARSAALGIVEGAQ